MAADQTATKRTNLSRRPGPVLVGREREQVFLREELGAALGGYGGLVLLGGEAGIGKTTLARDLAREAESRSMCVLAGNCYDLTNTPPYGPWLDLIAGYRSDSDLPSPPPTFAGGMLDQVTDQAALFAEFRRFFADLSAARPTCVFLEDLHWADPASLELLRHLAPHVRRWPLLFLVTYRIDEPTRRHPFYQQLPALVREAEGLRIDLKQLDAAALRALVAARYALPSADEVRLSAYLEQHTEGNPFFATELLRAIEEEGLLQRTAEGWTLLALDHVFVPTFLRQVIEERVARLGEGTRHLLAIASVIGQEVPLALWSRLANVDDEGLLAVVEQAVDAHLVEAEREGTRVRFVHALTRDALFEGILPPRRRSWHQRIAELLLTDDRPDPDAVAFHLQQAGDPRAWEWLERAGERAHRAYAWLTAIERFRSAADLLAGVEGAERTRGRMLYRIARLARFSDPTGAFGDVDEAARLAARIGDPILTAEVSYHRGVLLCYSNHFRSGLAEMVSGIEALEAMPLEVTRPFALTEPWLTDALQDMTSADTSDDSAIASVLHAAGFHYRRGVYPWFLASSGRLHDAIATGESFAGVLADSPGTWQGIRSVAAFSYFGLGIAYAALGRPVDARQAFARARLVFREVDHHALITYTLLTELHDVVLTYDAADPSVRRRIAAEAEVALTRAGGALHPGLSPRLAWLGCHVFDGQWDEAVRILDDLPEPGSTYLRREVTYARSMLARCRGEPEVAWAQIRALFPEGAATEPGDHIHQEGLWLQLLASDLCLDAGDLEGARAWLTTHDEWLTWSGSVLGQADGRLSWARYHQVGGDIALARLSASDALVLASTVDQPLVCLATHRLLGEIETVDGAYLSAEMHLTAALDLATACDAPFERALALLTLAELRAAMDASGEATALLDDVREICMRLGALPTLARSEALAARLSAKPPGETYPAGLTQREVDVLRLLAQRQTDKEIAEALFLGPRTIQSHVAHILNKLSVDNRREAAAEAARLGLL